MCVNRMKCEQTCPDYGNEQTRGTEIEKELKNHEGNNSMENHIGEVVPPRIESVECEINKMRENGKRTVVNEGFATQFFPVVRGKGVLNGIEATDVWIPEYELAITCHKLVREGIPVYPHGYKREKD